MGAKPTVGTAWLQGCSGCHISFLDLHGELLNVLDIVDIVSSPIIDVKHIPEMDVGLIEGAVGTSDNEEVLKEFREKAKVLIAFGTCACIGGVSGLRNLFTREEVLRKGYIETVSTKNGKIPVSPEIPELIESVRSIDQVVRVDAYIPGCPPSPADIKNALVSLLTNKEMIKKTRCLCEECNRTKNQLLESKRHYITETVMSVCELDNIDPKTCFLEQGVMCIGPATVEGCGAKCPAANIPCRGCYGPVPHALEQGAKIINALSSILPAGDLMFNEDMIGSGYRYSLPVSMIPKIKDSENKTGGESS